MNKQQTCGKIKFFKRATDPVSGTEKSFGFCEFEQPEGVLRAIAALNGLPVFNEQLLVKVDSKTQAYLERYQAAKLAARGSDAPSAEAEANEQRRFDLLARRVLDAQLDRRENLRARMPKPGHCDGRRATPELDNEFALDQPSMAAMSDDDVRVELERLRASQEARGRKLSASAPPPSNSSSSSSSSSSSRRDDRREDRRDDRRDSRSDSNNRSSNSSSNNNNNDNNNNNNSSSSNSSSTAALNASNDSRQRSLDSVVDALQPEAERQAARDAVERTRIRDARHRELRRREELIALIADERAREAAGREKIHVNFFVVVNF